MHPDYAAGRTPDILLSALSLIAGWGHFLRISMTSEERPCYTAGMPTMVSFLSDFGLEDSYVAQVKARILSAHPGATIVDITHSVGAYAILSGAWLLHTAFSAFPAGSIHLALVDPGVGTSRRVLVVEKDGHTFVGPDNGVFSFLYPAERITDVTWRPSGHIAPTFHGRDVFAPLVCRLLGGEAASYLGASISDPVILDTTTPQVVHIDRFGNIITNIRPEDLDGHALVVKGQVFKETRSTFEDLPQDGVGLIVGSAGTIEIVGRRRDAGSMLGVRIGTPLALVPAA